VKEALSSGGKYVIWRGDVTQYPKFKDWFTDNHPDIPVVSVFMLPGISFQQYVERVVETRGERGACERTPKAVTEIGEASTSVDVVLLNPPDTSGKPVQAATALVEYLRGKSPLSDF
jgi:hypothetical protein